jgi:hypothetical protein
MLLLIRGGKGLLFYYSLLAFRMYSLHCSSSDGDVDLACNLPVYTRMRPRTSETSPLAPTLWTGLQQEFGS